MDAEPFDQTCETAYEGAIDELHAAAIHLRIVAERITLYADNHEGHFYPCNAQGIQALCSIAGHIRRTAEQMKVAFTPGADYAGPAMPDDID